MILNTEKVIRTSPSFKALVSLSAKAYAVNIANKRVYSANSFITYLRANDHLHVKSFLVSVQPIIAPTLIIWYLHYFERNVGEQMLFGIP